jgi:hypothetical protein
MAKLKYLIIGLVVLIGASTLILNSVVDAEFKGQDQPATLCPTSVFAKSAVIFDNLLICGTILVPDDKLIHAAHVAAEWLDNDGDGVIDEPALGAALKESKSLVVMSFDGFSSAAALKIFPLATAGGYTLQDLSAQETNNPVRRDASQEEIHHIIMNGGWMRVFPKVFSDQADDGSDLYAIWKFADDNGHYSYGDPTCDDSCKTVEFFYLATAAYLGSMADLFSDEMRLKNRSAMQKTIPEIMNIFESNDYSYPTDHWPSGTYAHQDNIRFSGVQGR